MNHSMHRHPGGGEERDRAMNRKLMCLRSIAIVLALGLGSAQAVAEQGDPDPRAEAERGELEVTLRIIEDPRAYATEAVTRHIQLPPVATDAGEEHDRGADGREISQEARELGREFGEETSERARELSEQAREQREDFGRSRAEEMRPEPPQPTPPPGG
jgi:hypothetical protein